MSTDRSQTTNISPPTRIPKPWGYELIWAHTERYVGKILYIEGGHSLSRQYHNVKDETIYVSRGELILELGQGETLSRTRVPAGQGFRVKPGLIHRFIAEETVELMEVATPEVNDVIRLEDEYGREGTSEP